MSSTLTWKPKASRGSLPDELKHALKKRFGDPIDTIATATDIDFLRGLAAANIKGATKLIDLIEKHVEVEIQEEW